jgi:hypothetical protein
MFVNEWNFETDITTSYYIDQMRERYYGVKERQGFCPFTGNGGRVDYIMIRGHYANLY